MAYPYIASLLPFLDSTRISSVYDYKFERTPNHLSDEQLESYRWSYDDIASKAIERLEERRIEQKDSDNAYKAELYQKLREEAEKGEDPLVAKFWSRAHEVPDWVDWDAIARGQDVGFWRHGWQGLAHLVFRLCIDMLDQLGSLSISAVCLEEW